MRVMAEDSELAALLAYFEYRCSTSRAQQCTALIIAELIAEQLARGSTNCRVAT